MYRYPIESQSLTDLTGMRSGFSKGFSVGVVTVASKEASHCMAEENHPRMIVSTLCHHASREPLILVLIQASY